MAAKLTIIRGRASDKREESNTMLISQLYPSKYITAADLQGRTVTLTITVVTLEEMQSHDNKRTQKPVCWFERTNKGLVMNVTNAKIIANLHGDNTDDWKGKRVSLYPTTVKAFGQMQSCIRVREVIPAQPKPTAQTAAVEESIGLDDEEDVMDYQDEDVASSADPASPAPADPDPALWEPDIAPRATEEQLARLNELGETYYSAQWQQVKDRNVKRISAGKATRAGDLTPDQIQKLIDGIVGLMNSKATNGVAK